MRALKEHLKTLKGVFHLKKKNVTNSVKKKLRRLRLVIFFTHYSSSGCRMKYHFSCLLCYFAVFGYQIKQSLSCLIMLILGVWIRLTHLSRVRYRMIHSSTCLMYYFLVFRDQIKHSISCLVSQCRMKYSSSCLTYYFLMFKYQMKHSLSCLIGYFLVFWYRMKHSTSCLMHYFLVFGHQIKHFSSWNKISWYFMSGTKLLLVFGI